MLTPLLDPYLYETAATHQAELRDEARMITNSRLEDSRGWRALLRPCLAQRSAEHPCLFRLLWAPR